MRSDSSGGEALGGWNFGSTEATGAKRAGSEKVGPTSLSTVPLFLGVEPCRDDGSWPRKALDKVHPLPDASHVLPRFSSRGEAGPRNVGHTHDNSPGSIGGATCARPGAQQSSVSDPLEKEWPLGLSLVELGEGVLNKLLRLPFHSKPTGKTDRSRLFPLPTSRAVVSTFLGSATSNEVAWVLAMAHGLNSLWGEAFSFEGEISLLQGRVLEGLLNDVHRMELVKDRIDAFDWSSFFKSRSVDYQGEEVKTAKRFCWNNIKPAIPPEIGVVELRDLCDWGCKFYVDHFPQHSF